MESPSTQRLERRVSIAGLTLFAYGIVAATISIVNRWPAQLGGAGDPSRVAREFLSRGTATAPPLLPLLLLGVAALVVRSGSRWRVPATVILFIIGGLHLIGGFGEIASPDPVTTPRPVLIVAGVIAIAGGAVLAFLSGLLLEARHRERAA